MSDHTDSRLRELTYRLIDMAPEAPPFPEDPMVRLERSPTLVTPVTRRRPLVWVGAAAAAAIILIGGPLLLISLNADPGPAPPATQITVPDQPTPTTAAPQPTVPDLVLSSTGLGMVDLGTDAEAAIVALSSTLGAPTLDTGWLDGELSNCPGTEVRDVSWSQLTLGFTDVRDEFAPDGGRHLFQYSFGYADPADASTPAEPLGLATAEGITVGSTVAELKAAYGSDLELFESSAVGHSWLVDGGTLLGQLTGIADDDLVLSVEAGYLCPE